MKPRRLKEQLIDVYASASLPAGTVDRLLLMAKLAEAAAAATGRIRRRWRIRIGVATCLAVLLAGNFYFALRGAGVAPAPPAVPTPATAEVLLGPGLVLARIHADWCRRSQDLTPFYLELGDKYRNQPILFVTLDITDDSRRQQAAQLVAALGIQRALESPFESGMLKLIDRDSGRILATVIDQSGAQGLEDAVAQALTPPP